MKTIARRLGDGTLATARCRFIYRTTHDATPFWRFSIAKHSRYFFDGKVSIVASRFNQYGSWADTNHQAGFVKADLALPNF